MDTNTIELKSVALEQKHKSLGAKMVPFAGYLMPLKYSNLTEEHLQVRQGVGIFDVSHMGEFILAGPNALHLIQRISTNDAANLEIGDAQYTCMPNDTGGIVDDMIVYRLGPETYMLVVNASNMNKDWDWIQSHNTDNVQMENRSDDYSLFAVQGPKATAVLQQLTTAKLSDIPYYKFIIGNIAEVENVIISATGYTGAGGFELYVENENALQLWDKILEAGHSEGILPIGLGARDTLRLEMGYCLYGNDINDTTSPIEAGLGWVTKFNKDFVNSDFLQRQKEEGVKRKLIAFKMLERGIPRQGYDIVDEEGNAIGNEKTD